MSTKPPGPLDAPKPQVKALNCPQCGAAITLRALGQAVTVICEGCHSVLDAKDPKLQILQTFEKIISADRPLIPLGSRGKLRGTLYEVIGFTRRGIQVDGVRYFWHEYVLFNPYKGFRYLSEYQGHWNDVAICKELPKTEKGEEFLGNQARIPMDPNYLGEDYKHFQTADANTDFVLGEFPWEVRVGEHAKVTDYVHPPRLLSMERTGNEVTWSVGEYITGAEVWKAFQLPGSAPEAVGVFENQPTPFKTNMRGMWKLFAVMAIILLVMLVGFDIGAKKEPVFHKRYSFEYGQKGEASFVTDTFELKGSMADVEVETSTDFDNQWIYLNYALINEDTGQAWDFGREVSYYSGYDSDGSWSEGHRNDSVVVPSVPAGKYYLRIEPESDAVHRTMLYTVDVTRDVTVPGFYAIGFFALLAPVLVMAWRSYSFERARWSESDHPPMPIFQQEG